MQSADDNWMGGVGGGGAERPVMRLCVRAVISSRCKCFLVQVCPLIYSSKGIFINPPLVTRLWKQQESEEACDPTGSTNYWSFCSQQGKHWDRGDVFSWITSICLGRLVFFIFNTRNVRQAGEVSSSDVTRSCVSSACLPAFILVGLFPVCTSHVCSSGAWNAGRALTLPRWCGDAQKSCILSWYLKCTWTIFSNQVIFTPKMSSPLKASFCACVLIMWAWKIKRQAL